MYKAQVLSLYDSDYCLNNPKLTGTEFVFVLTYTDCFHSRRSVSSSSSSISGLNDGISGSWLGSNPAGGLGKSCRRSMST